MYDCTQTCADTCLYLQRNALRDTVICPTAAAKRRARLRQITLPYLTLPDLQQQHLAGRGYAALGRLIAPIWLAHSAG